MLQLVGEHQVGQLRLSVGQPPLVALVPVEVVQPDPPGPVQEAGQRDHPVGDAGQQVRGEREMA
ncbi:MAG: hypothetical protein ACRDQ5_22750, partial [Sciscionella sp.]